MSRVVLRLVVIGVLLGGLALVKLRARRRALAEEQAGGCVACGSQRVEAGPEQITCLDCGYTGSADRGGELASHEINAIYEESSTNERGW